MENTNTVCARAAHVRWTVGLFGLVALGIVLTFVWFRWSTSPVRQMQQRLARARAEAAAAVDDGPPADSHPPYQPVPVPTNRRDDLSPGFRGEVHPLLHGKTSLEVSAHWMKVGTGRDHLEQFVSPNVYAMFTELKPVTAKKLYTERDFSRLLPESVESVGQVWEIDLDSVATILRQFHPQPAMHLIALGRRAGPDGAFGVLRGVSATHLDVMFRVHAEFDIGLNVWYTPACFWGRMIVDKKAGTVESFRLWLPTELPLNVHLTVAGSSPRGTRQQPVVFRKIEPGDVVGTKRDIVHVDQMELVSANPQLAEEVEWADSIDIDVAQRELKKCFYAFTGINWVPWQTALEAAGQQHKPILAIVLWGALDDQSC
ncbi:MAG TPA: hypothetical protein VGH74_05040 [Planctomycetaceae bacterium]|jgi:hypothetical protein